MFVIECRSCGFYFDADAPDRNICIPCLRDEDRAGMIEALKKVNHDEFHNQNPKGGKSHEERSKTTK